jgi:hypothetical protein
LRKRSEAKFFILPESEANKKAKRTKRTLFSKLSKAKRSENIANRKEFSHKFFWSIFVNQKYDESYLSPAMDLKSPHHFYPTSCCGPQQQNGGVVHVDEKSP